MAAPLTAKRLPGTEGSFSDMLDATLAQQQARLKNAPLPSSAVQFADRMLNKVAAETKPIDTSNSSALVSPVPVSSRASQIQPTPNMPAERSASETTGTVGDFLKQSGPLGWLSQAAVMAGTLDQQESIEAADERLVRETKVVQDSQKALAAQVRMNAMRKQDANAAAFAQPGELRPLQGDEHLQNDDGTISTELTMTVTMPDGGIANIPSLWMKQGNTRPDRFTDEKTAIDTASEYERLSGKAFQRYATIDEATAAAEARSEAGGAGVENAPLADNADQQALAISEEDEKRATLSASVARRDTAKVAVDTGVGRPTQTWWLNATQQGVKSGLMTGTSALRSAAALNELIIATATGSEPERIEARAVLDGIDKELQALLPGDKTQASTFVNDLAAGAGSMTAFMVAGVVGRAMGAGVALGSGVLGGASQAGSQYADADAHGATMTQKWIALMVGAGIGASEAWPIDRMFLRAEKLTGGLVTRLLKTTTAGSAQEFAQELFQNMSSDMLAQVTYDKDRKIDVAQQLRQATVGGILGGGASAMVTVLDTAKAPQTGEDVKLSVEAAQRMGQQVFDKAQADFDATIGEEEVTTNEEAGAALPQEEAETADEEVQQTDAAEPVDVAVALEEEKAVATEAAVEEAAQPQVEIDPVQATKAAAILESLGIEPTAINAAAQTLVTLNEQEAVSELRTKEEAKPATIEKAPQAYKGGTVPALRPDGKVELTHWASEPVQVLDPVVADTRTKQSTPELRRAGDANWVPRVYYGVDAHFKRPSGHKKAQAKASKDGTQGAQSGLGYVNEGLFGPVRHTVAIDPDSLYNWIEDPLSLDAKVTATTPGERATQKEKLIKDAGFDGIWFERSPVGAAATLFAPLPVESIHQDFTNQWIKAPPNGTPLPKNMEKGVKRPEGWYPSPAELAKRVKSVELTGEDLSRLPDLNASSTGPIASVVQAARAYAQDAGIPFRRQASYVQADPERGARIAREYENMEHDPNNPAVASAFEAMIQETLAQYQYVKASGLKVEFIEPGQPDPYPEGPKQVLEDLQRGHLWTFPTDQGYGTDTVNPMLRPTEEFVGERRLLANDVFRIVHDFFGHGMEGSNFGARGEENAWQSHMRLFTEKALPAVTSETRGQNSWVNFGPHGEANRKNQKKTVYADQKTGLMPNWTWREGVDYDTAVDAIRFEETPEEAVANDGSVESGLIEVSETPDTSDAFKALAAEAQIARDEADTAISAMTANNRAPYVGEQVRPQRGITDPNTEPNTQPDENLTSIGQNLIKLIGATVRTGRLMRKKGVQGQYNFHSGVLRMKSHDDLSTLTHEAGHAFHDNRSPTVEAWIDTNEAAVIGLGASLYPQDLSNATVDTQRKEGFAEFFRIFTLNRNYSRKRFPTLTNSFEAMLNREDQATLKGLDQIGTQFGVWMNLPSTQIVKSFVTTSARPGQAEELYTELREGGITEFIGSRLRTLLEAGINKFAPLDTIVNGLVAVSAANGRLVDLKRAYDPRALARLASNSSARAMVQVRDGVMGYRDNDPTTAGLQSAIMVSQGLDANSSVKNFNQDRLDDFDAYLVAKRALVEYENQFAGELDRAPVGFSRGDAQRAVVDYERKYGQSFKQAAQLVHEYGMALWKKTYDAGLMTTETYKEGLSRTFYVPLLRDMSDRGRKDLGPSVLTRGETSVVKRFRGSDRRIISPLEALMQKTFALEQTIIQNDIKKSLAMLAGKAGTGAGEFAERIPAKQLIGTSLSVEEIGKRLSGHPEMSAVDAQDLVDILTASMSDGAMITMFRAEAANTLGENIVFFWENGQLQALQLKDGDTGKSVVNLMHAIGTENMPLGTETIAATSGAFRAAITAWPDFAIVNYIRDQVSAWVLTDVGFVPFVSGARGIADEVRQSKLSRDFNAAMGTMGGMNVSSLHTARIDRDLDALRSRGYIADVFAGEGFLGAVQGIARLTSVTETGTRMGIFRGAYNRAIADGLSEYEAGIEAAYTATDYINFGQHGSRTMLARRTVPFLNAALQGLYKQGRAMFGDEARMRIGFAQVLRAYFKGVNGYELTRVEKQQINNGRKVWVKMLALGFISAAIALAYKDDEDYQGVSEYIRNTNWVFPMGEGRIIAIPKPFQLALIANFTERAIESANGDDKAMGRFLTSLYQMLSIPHTVPVITTGWELAMNKDTFTGGDIVPGFMQSLPPELQYNQYTSEISKQIAKMTGMSAMKIDHLLDGIGASAARDLKTVSNQLNPNSGTMDPTDAPILRRFYRDTTRGNAAVRDFWAQASLQNGQLRQIERGYKHYIDVGNEAAAANFLETQSDDGKAYALLMQQSSDEKRLHPMYRARQISTLVSEMRREIASDIGLDDTGIAGDKIRLSPKMKTDADNLLSDFMTREIRNTMIATEQPGWADKKKSDVSYTIDIIREHSPELADELDRRMAKAKVYNGSVVEDNWPELKTRLLQDREFAVLSDLTAIAASTPR